MTGMLTAARDELPDSPLYYTVASLCQAAKIVSPKVSVFRAGLLNAGYLVSQAHSCPDGLKTNAPNHVVFDVLRAYSKQVPPKITGMY